MRLLVALLLSATAASAHDFWIEPSSFTPAPGALVKLTLRVGERLEGEAVPRFDARIERFDAVAEPGATKVAGIDGGDPAGLVRPAAAGGVVIVYRSLREPVEVPAAKYEEYLALEGLESISKTRASRGQSGSPGREVFSRCAKTLLAVGGKAGTGATRPAGLTLELVPETDPYTLAPGGKLTVRLLYLGKPQAGALVMALDRASAGAPQKVRSDASGRATFTLPRSGLWLVKAVHMIPAPAGASADWESFWASLTFELAAAR